VAERPGGLIAVGGRLAAKRRDVVMSERMEWPKCQKCGNGTLIPLSDYGREGAPITYKAWVCTNPDCGFNLRIDNGEISFGRVIGQSFK
jgi:hypothetical protein